ncbi:IS607 family element transposase accessory protein TnpB [Pseudonocardia sp. DSM 110487]|nr:IS607 family element transposase accessory protein TnpB [Pseudonocardia sp. DSM 110487]
MIRAFLFALDPTPAQVQAFRSHCGAQRFAFNFGLALVRANLDQRAAERSYGIAEPDLTPAVSWSAYGLRRTWNAAKHQVAPWWAENSKEAYSSGLANLAAALSNWSSSRSGTRAGPRVAFPRFKRRRSRPSCRFTTGAFGLAADRRHVRLPRIGAVRTHESTRKLARKIETGQARIRSATLSWQRGRWHVSFSVELLDREPVRRGGGRVVGVDLGISTLATLSTGERVRNGQRLERELARLRRAQRRASRRRGPDRRTGQEPSNRWRKARARADRIHTRVANLRRNDIHQLTTRLVLDHDVIVIEDLYVVGMLRNRHLARHIAGAAWAEIRRQLSYKAQRAGIRLVVADRWFASSKTCSGCGTANPSWPCPSGRSCARRADWSWIGTSTPRGTWPRSRPTPASCAGSSPTEPVSDQRGPPRWQSDRCGKGPAGLNVTAARRWLDERNRMSRLSNGRFTCARAGP